MRARELSEDRRTLVEVAALAGVPLPEKLLLRAAGRPPGDYAVLRDLCDHHFLRRLGGVEEQQIQVDHDCLREALGQQLAEDARRSHYRNLVSATEHEGWGRLMTFLTNVEGAENLEALGVAPDLFDPIL